MAWRKAPPQMQEHLPHHKIFSPNPQPYGYGYTPGACSQQSLPLRLTLDSFPVGDRGALSMCQHACTCTCVHMCTYVKTHLPFVHQKLRDIKKAFTQDSLSVHFAVNLRAGNVCILKGGRGERFLRDYYNHHHCNYHHHYLLIMMVLII